MKRYDRKSDCAINYALEQIGDPWTLLIVRDIVFFGKKTFNQFLSSEERIGTTTLTRRLKEMEEKGLLMKTTNTEDRRIEDYFLTKKGLDLIPLLLDLTMWGAHYDRKTGANKSWIRILRKNKNVIGERLRKAVEKRLCLKSEYDSVIAGL